MEHETLQLTQEERGSSGDILDTTYYGGDQSSAALSNLLPASGVTFPSSKQCHNYKHTMHPSRASQPQMLFGSFNLNRSMHVALMSSP